MKTLLASTAIALAVAVSAHADGHAIRATDGAMSADTLIGAPLYIARDRIDRRDGFSPDWLDGGEIVDVDLDDRGRVVTVMASFDGLFDGGDAPVAIDADDLSAVADPGAEGDYFLVVNGIPNALRMAPEFEDAPVTRTGGVVAVDTEGSGMTTSDSPAITTRQTGQDDLSPIEMDQGQGAAQETDVADLDDGTVVDNRRTPATARIEDGQVETTGGNSLSIAADALRTAPDVERAGYTPTPSDMVTPAQMEGVEVYGLDDERLGEIDSAMADSERPMAILEMGGFLGIGERRVAIPVEEMTFLDGEDGLRAYLDATPEALEDYPDYEG